MAAGEGIDVAGIAQTTLDAVVAHFAASEVQLPDRRVIAPGEPRTVAWDCVAEGCIVNTARGPVPIEEVLVGDSVWAWDNGHMRLAPVTATIPKGERATIRIRTRHRAVDVTPEHRMLIVRCRGRRAPGGPNDWVTEWVPARDLLPDDCLVAAATIPDEGHERYLSDGTKLDEEVAWLLGLIVADGTVVTSGLHLCVFGQLADAAASVISRVWGIDHSSRDAKHGLVVSSRRLTQTLTDLGLHRRSVERAVPSLLLNSPHKAVRAFLDGYAAGDAHTCAKGISYATANGALAEQLRALHMSIGDNVSNLCLELRTKPITIRGKQVVKALPLHRFSAYPGSRKVNGTVLNYRGARRALPDLHFTVDKVHSVEAGPAARTYDLTVEGAHTFLADGLVAHNCESMLVTCGGILWGQGPGTNSGTARATGNPVSVGARHTVIAVQIVRCVPETDGVNPPDPDELTDAGLALMRDAGLLSQALVELCGTSGALRSAGVAMAGGVEILGPAGGYAACEGNLTVTAGALT